MAHVMIVVPPMQASSVPPQLGTGYLASGLRAKGHVVDLVHCDYLRIGPEAFEARVLRSRPDVVGFTVVTMAYQVVRDICRRLRRKGFKNPIVLGGPHASALPELTLRQVECDALITNEGDVAFPLLVEALEAGRSLSTVPGVTWLGADGKMVVNPRPPVIDDLDTIPFPAWDLMPPKTFPPAPHQLFFRRFPTAPIMTSRGCPYPCTYCASQGTWGRSWRYRSVDNVMEEITLLVKKYGVRELHFEDDELAGDEDRLVELCERIASANLDLVWSCPNGIRTNAMNDRIAKAMARAGCYEVGLGIDVPAREQMKRVKKPRKPDQAQKAVDTIRRHGMEARGFWLLGIDTDTEADVKHTIDFALSLPTEFGAFGVHAILPGSPDFDTFMATGVDLENFDWSQLSYFKARNSPHIPAERLQGLLREAILRFYLRPTQMKAILKRVKARQAPYIARGLYRYLTGYFEG